ncbi:uncharacterized protein BDR25DRAFT_364114, partial [Lindgomyces ingoldianus]
MLFPTTYHTYAYYMTESSLQGLCETFLSIIYVLLTAGAKYHNAIPDYPQTIWMHTILQNLACRAFAKRGWCSIPPKTQMRLAPNTSQVPQCYSRLPTNHTYAYYITESGFQSLCETFLSIIYVLLTAGGGWCSIPPKTQMQLAPNASQ